MPSIAAQKLLRHQTFEICHHLIASKMENLNCGSVSCQSSKMATINDAKTVMEATSPKILLAKAQQSVLHKFIVHLFETLCFVMSLVLFICLTPILMIFKLYRQTLHHIIKKKWGEIVMPCAGGDCIWLQDTPVNRAIINAVMTMKGKCDIEHYQKTFNERLVEAKKPDSPEDRLYSKFSKYPTKILHRYVWIDEDNFDIKDHVILHPKPYPENKVELEKMVSKICNTPLPSKKAAWQVVILRPEDSKTEKYHIVFRIHHSMADGSALVRMMMYSLVDEVPIKVPVVKNYGKSARFIKAMHAIFSGPYILIQRMLWAADSSLLHGAKLSGEKVLTWSDPIELSVIKRCKNATGTTVNDILIACLTGAIRNYFTKFGGTIPSKILCYLPVDVRPPTDKVVLDNQFALVFLRLPLDQEDVIGMLQKTKETMDLVKASPEPVVNYALISYCMDRLPNWLTCFFFEWFSKKCSLVLSNVPGPQQPLSIAGQSLESVVFWPPQKGNVGIGVSLISYNGHVRIGISVDTAILTNPEVLVDAFVDQVNELHNRLKVE